jgi:hypothetical protein
MTPEEEQRSEEILSLIAMRTGLGIQSILFVSTDYCLLAICSTLEDITSPETVQHFELLKTLSAADREFRHHCVVNYIKESNSSSSFNVPIVKQV